MERGRQTLGSKSTGLVTQAHLLRFVRGACEGRNAQDSDRFCVRDPNLTVRTFEDLEQRLHDFLRQLAERMGPAFSDKSSIHLSSGGWQVLGLIFHDLEFALADQLSTQEKEAVYDRLARLDWSRYNPKWIELLGGENDTEIDENRRRYLAKTTKWGRRIKGQMLDYVRSECGLQRCLDQIEAEAPHVDVTIPSTHRQMEAVQ